MKKSRILVMIGAGIWCWMIMSCAHMNTFQQDGEIRVSGLKSFVEVLRDEKGMAYIYATNDDDLLWTQGFVTAQDRLFQMELTRLFVSGRISELVGGPGRESDIRMRTVGFVRQAKKHAAILKEETRRYLQSYVDGVNAFINRTAEMPLEFKLSGIRPKPWTLADSLAIGYLMGWGSAANIKDEIIAQMLVEKLGPEKARGLFPLNINPDSENICRATHRDGNGTLLERQHLELDHDKALMAFWADQSPGFRVGSNSWVTGTALSTNGKPVVANDPHLDARTLPGPWYPCGLIAPSVRAVGIAIPGVPGITAGRTDHIAIGMTNSYGDGQDLYIETVDPKSPEHYLEGNRSHPFEIVTETMKIRDPNGQDGFREEKIIIRLTKRGPVVSGSLKGLDKTHVITLRWSPFETMGPSLGVEGFLKAKNVDDIRENLRNTTMIMLNFVFADLDGRFGWQTTGRLPIRARGDGLIPFKVTDDRDNWTGWIPFEKMPHAYDLKRGWIGTCNHNMVPCDYPYYYTSHASASYRYRRLSELMDAPGKKSVDDHWRFQRDTVNLMAKKIAPIMARALIAHGDTAALGRILGRWDYRDDPDAAGPTIFQAVYRQFFFAVYQDELGIPLAKALIDNPYFWQEYLQQVVLAGESPWFDDISTPSIKETRDDLFHKAALAAIRELGPDYGSDPEGWTWGRMHRIRLVSPISREGFISEILGSGSRAMGGSQETLYRARFDYNKPYDVTVSASLRMVADLGDPDKVLAVLPGGVSGRLFDPHFQNQVEPFLNGEIRYWWFSDKKIKENARKRLYLIPASTTR